MLKGKPESKVLITSKGKGRGAQHKQIASVITTHCSSGVVLVSQIMTAKK